jgi:hypothetical protein
MEMHKRSNSPFATITASANMPNTCWGKYGRVGVVELTAAGLVRLVADPDWQPQIRTTRYLRVISTWERCFWGSSDRCALALAEDDVAEMCADLERKWINDLHATRNAALAMREPEEL